MKLPSLLKTPKHKRFNYKSVYYNPEKEKLKKGLTNKSLFYEQYVSKKAHKEVPKQALITRLIIIFVLLILVYLIIS